MQGAVTFHSLPLCWMVAALGRIHGHACLYPHPTLPNLVAFGFGPRRFRPHKPLEVVAFTSEEPTRFGLSCSGSRAMAGAGPRPAGWRGKPHVCL